MELSLVSSRHPEHLYPLLPFSVPLSNGVKNRRLAPPPPSVALLSMAKILTMLSFSGTALPAFLFLGFL